MSAILSGRRALGAPVSPDLATRTDWVRALVNLLRKNSQHWAQMISEEEKFPAEAVERVQVAATMAAIENQLGSVSAHTDGDLSTGLTVIFAPRVFAFRVVLEQVAAAWISGDPVIVKLSRQASKALLELETQLRASVPEGWFSCVTESSDDVIQLLAGHPSVKALSYTGRIKRAEKILPAALNTWKKISAHFGGKNSALVLADADLEKVATSLLQDTLTWSGRAPWSVSRVYAVEAQQQPLLEVLEKQITRSGVVLVSQEQAEKAKALVAQIKKEEGKVIAGGDVYEEQGVWKMIPCLVRDLPNCSELQQDELDLPFLLVGSVKYAHDLAKWNNITAQGLVAQVWGSEEKAQKLMSKLEVGEVWLNHGINDGGLKQLPVGVKQSVWGITDRQAFGEFFSSRRKIVSAH